jgi:hypothetical protein
MKRLLSSAALAVAILGASAPAAWAQYSVVATGNISGGAVSPPPAVMTGLATGVVQISTSTGGTMTIRLPPAVGQAIATAAKTPSPANGQAAGQALGGALRSAGLPGGVASSCANAIAAIGTGANRVAESIVVSNAMGVLRAAMASRTITEEQARSLAALLAAAAATR